MSASSHRPFPCPSLRAREGWGMDSHGRGTMTSPMGIPYPIPISSVILGVVRRGEVPPFGACADGPKDVSDAANGRGRGSRGSLRGLAPSCTRRRVPPSRRRGATLSRGGPTVIHCRRAPFFAGKRGVRYPFVSKAGRCRRRWGSSTQFFESRSARVPL